MKKFLLLVMLLPIWASAQANFGSPFVFVGVPSGTCASNQLAVNSSNGDLYSCNNGTWRLSGASLPSLTDSGTLVTSSSPIRVPVGAQGADSIQFNSASTGFYSTGGNNVTFDAGGVRFDMSNVGIRLSGSSMFAAGASVTVPDVFLFRRTTATWQFGTSDVNGVPVAQTLSMQNAITGSNLAGANFTLAGSLGTGIGTPALLNFTGGAIGASGTTAQTGISRLAVNDTKQLTTGAATTVVSIPLATLQMAGGTIDYHLEATDGTSQCTRDGQMSYNAENSAGVFVTSVTNAAGGNDTTSCTATKTLTLAWAVTGANPALVQVTPTLTGITATTFQIVYEVHHKGQTQPTL